MIKILAKIKKCIILLGTQKFERNKKKRKKKNEVSFNIGVFFFVNIKFYITNEVPAQEE